MKAATQTNEQPLIHPRPSVKARAVVVVVFVAVFTFGLLESAATPHEPQVDLITAVTIAALWALALWAVLGVRERTTFSVSGVVDVGVLRKVSLRWG